jgi:hypothetical protein
MDRSDAITELFFKIRPAQRIYQLQVVEIVNSVASCDFLGRLPTRALADELPLTL